MQNTGNRDESVDRLLRQALSKPNVAAPGGCLDAETVAAWSDGALSPADAARVETHLSECAQCQALFAAFARAIPPPPAPQSLWQRWRLQWLVPITAAATAVAVWVAIPVNERPGGLPRSDVRVAAPAESSQAAAPAAGAPASPQSPLTEQVVPDPEQFAAPVVAEPPASLDDAVQEEATGRLSAEARNQVAEPAERREVIPTLRSRDVREQEASLAQGQAAKAVSPPARVAAADAVERVEESVASAPPEQRGFASQPRNNAVVDVVSLNPANRWRIVGDTRVDRSTDGGQTWAATVIAPPAALTAGSAPGPVVCWLVGPAGAVRLTTDGLRFQQVPFPEVVDLIGVQATSADRATVTAIDGRRFRTDDQGRTWSPVAP